MLPAYLSEPLFTPRTERVSLFALARGIGYPFHSYPARTGQTWFLWPYNAIADERRYLLPCSIVFGLSSFRERNAMIQPA